MLCPRAATRRAAARVGVDRCVHRGAAGLALTFKADTTGVTKGRADTAVRPYKLPELPNSDWSESTVGGRHHLPSLGTRVRVRGGGVGRVLTPGRGLGGRSQLGDRAAVSRVGASARGSAAGAGPGASFRPRNAICLEQIRGHAARKRREDLDEPQGHSRRQRLCGELHEDAQKPRKSTATSMRRWPKRSRRSAASSRRFTTASGCIRCSRTSRLWSSSRRWRPARRRRSAAGVLQAWADLSIRWAGPERRWDRPGRSSFR